MLNPATPLYPDQSGDQPVAWILGLNQDDFSCLAKLLENSGFKVIAPKSPNEFNNKNSSSAPSIVFIDPSTAEFDATAAPIQIRKRFGPRYTAVVFFAQELDEDFTTTAMLADCDDILNKAYTEAALKLTLRRIDRIRSLHGTNRSLSAEIQQHTRWVDSFYNDRVIAKNVASRFIRKFDANGQAENLDLLISRFSLSGELCILFGTFTGHKVAAKMASHMVADAFHAMLSKGFTITDIAGALNEKIFQSLPDDLTLYAQLITIGSELDHIAAINCGSNAILVFDGTTAKPKSRIDATAGRLGILADLNTGNLLTRVSIQSGDRVVLSSVPAAETVDPGQDLSGITYHEAEGPEDLKIIALSLDIHTREHAPSNRPNLLCISCVPEIMTAAPARSNHIRYRVDSAKDLQATEVWNFRLRLNGSILGKNNPIPSIMSQIQELENLNSHYQILFTILTELYLNAIDHGVLNLDSSLKHSPEGFDFYFRERDKKLKALTEGWISFSIRVVHSQEKGCITILVEDSGPGFRQKHFSVRSNQCMPYHGRGILLLRELCDLVEFDEPGNKTRAVYSWDRQKVDYAESSIKAE